MVVIASLVGTVLEGKAFRVRGTRREIIVRGQSYFSRLPKY
jgi:hypothetical protein